MSIRPLALCMVLLMVGCGGSSGSSEEGDTIGDTVQILDTDAISSDLSVPDDTGQDTPAEDAPAEDTSAEDTSAEDTPTEDAAVDTSPDQVQPGPCSVALQDCPGGEHCIPNHNETALECQPYGSIQAGQFCQPDEPAECDMGLVCIPWSEGVGVCRKLCDEQGQPSCPAEAVCTPWWDALGLGICMGDDCTPPAEGCDEGMRCSVLLGQVMACIPAGDAGIGQDCSEQDCVAGAQCENVDLGQACVELCQEPADCSQEGTWCTSPWPDLPDWGTCVPGCNPIAQTGCAAGEGCYYSDPEEGTTLCWTEGSHEIGEDCSDMGLCVAGADCFADPGTGPDFTYHCYQYCDDQTLCQAGACQSAPEMTQSMKVGLCL